MRTIKFRGKDLKTGKWVYGDLHTLCDEPHIHTEPTHFPYAGERSFIDPETVGQFTGLHDKNGKEIYEDDILLNRHNRRYKVSWSDEEQRRILVNLLNADDYLNMYKNCMDDFEVIGNIHDNPELPKGGGR